MQSELIKFPEQLRHCQSPHGTSGGSVCASLLAATRAALELLPHAIWNLISRGFLDLSPWLWKGYRDLWKSERVSSVSSHFCSDIWKLMKVKYHYTRLCFSDMLCLVLPL